MADRRGYPARLALPGPAPAALLNPSNFFRAPILNRVHARPMRPSTLMLDMAYIGPYLAQQLQAADPPIRRFRDLTRYISTHTRRENTAFLRRCLRNRRAAQCVPTTRTRNPGHGYFTNRVNKMAYNSVLYNLIRYLSRQQQWRRWIDARGNVRFESRIPDFQPLMPNGRTALQSYPNRC
jgi:hypothetical protein